MKLRRCSNGKVIDHATEYAPFDVVRVYNSLASDATAFIGLAEVQPEGRLKAKRLMST